MKLLPNSLKSTKPAATFWIFLLRTKNRHLCCLVVTVHIVLPKNDSRLRKRNAFSTFEEIFPPITTKPIRTWTKKVRSYSIIANPVEPYWLIQLTKTSFALSFNTHSLYMKATWFSQSPTTVLSGVSTLYQIQWLCLYKILYKKWQ